MYRQGLLDLQHNFIFSVLIIYVPLLYFYYNPTGIYPSLVMHSIWQAAYKVLLSFKYLGTKWAQGCCWVHFLPYCTPVLAT